MVIGNSLPETRNLKDKFQLSSAIERLKRSTVFWTVTCLFAGTLVIGQLAPASEVKKSDFAGKRAQLDLVGAKVPEFFASKRSPDVLLLGSSLFMTPAVRCDDELMKRRTRYDASYIRDHMGRYLDAKFFEQRLSEHLNCRLSVANLATAGGVMSDQLRIFKKCCAAGKKPRLLVCDISPREFLDNQQPDPARTPVYIALADLTSMLDIFDPRLELNSVMESTLGGTWNVFRYRNDYRNVVINAAAWLTGYPSDLISALDPTRAFNKRDEGRHAVNWDGFISRMKPKDCETPPEYKPRVDASADIAHYKSMYLPVKKKLMEVQFSYLEELLTLARKEKVQVLLVELPLPRRNLNLLPAGVASTIYHRAQELSTKYDADYLVASKADNYSESDFEDIAHLNAAGGRKLFRAIAAAVPPDMGR
ncbi:MAG TPA: hypothetical protein V6D17_19070 [Candidatus Obscuribacterales bacterium]